MRDRGVTRERATELHDRRAAQVAAEKVAQRQGQVTVLRVGADVADAALIAPIAREFGAHAYAEDGTRYA
jgi:hypothetical protein